MIIANRVGMASKRGMMMTNMRARPSSAPLHITGPTSLCKHCTLSLTFIYPTVAVGTCGRKADMQWQ